MFLRVKKRFKDGKDDRYWSIVENHRTVLFTTNNHLENGYQPIPVKILCL